ncbi:hypothetical protein GOODEAATRI_007505 [Goodea atripinnis]|uniref:glutaminase n=1 Tax=Goodea atripinnis TaxID=208336 RepID=A0ABV0PLL8_9TELE
MPLRRHPSVLNHHKPVLAGIKAPRHQFTTMALLQQVYLWKNPFPQVLMLPPLVFIPRCFCLQRVLLPLLQLPSMFPSCSCLCAFPAGEERQASCPAWRICSSTPSQRDRKRCQHTSSPQCVQSNIVLLTQAFRKKFVIPDFQSFCAHIDELYDNGKNLSGGQVADYIPQLARFSPDLWGVALCTVDGQRHTAGDTKVPFCLQSCVKPLKYAIAVHDHGTEYVHRFIGKEPSGLRFNKLFLNDDGEETHAFQSEREFFSSQCFPEGTDMTSILDFYFQLCSIEVTCESASVMAATLANGGFCPITGERVLNPEAVRNTLSLMHSCGIRETAESRFVIALIQVGLPAKSGVAGGILLVVPNVMGIMCWSPPLDKLGNSVRGIQFCTDLVSLCNFHNYDNLRHFAKKLDPRREGGDQRVGLLLHIVKSVINLLFAAYTGDVSALRRFALSSMDMEQRDYDSRTALHVAAAEGHGEVVRFLLEACKVNAVPKDRWGNTPMDEAVHFGHHDVVTILRDYHNQYSPQDSEAEKQSAEKNLDGLL